MEKHQVCFQEEEASTIARKHILIELVIVGRKNKSICKAIHYQKSTQELWDRCSFWYLGLLLSNKSMACARTSLAVLANGSNSYKRLRLQMKNMKTCWLARKNNTHNPLTKQPLKKTRVASASRKWFQWVYGMILQNARIKHAILEVKDWDNDVSTIDTWIGKHSLECYST